MKTTLKILLLVSLSSAVYASSDLNWVDEQIEAIKPPRKSVKVTSLGTPFVFLKKNKPAEKKGSKAAPRGDARVASATAAKKTASTAEASVEKKRYLVLSAIMNASALIDGSWYKKSDKIDNYTVTDVSKDSVTLTHGEKVLVLSTASKNPNIKFKNK